MANNNRDKCILIYEDDPEILLLCKTILLKNQYRVETLVRCKNAINDIKELNPDIVLMDLWIPEIGGERAVALIKANPATASIPTLLFSASSDIREICEKIGADGYIQKPFDIHTFIETIEKCIR